jgi:hypothetical protein
MQLNISKVLGIWVQLGRTVHRVSKVMKISPYESIPYVPKSAKLVEDNNLLSYSVDIIQYGHNLTRK